MIINKLRWKWLALIIFQRSLLTDFFCCGIQLYVLLSPYLCFFSFLYMYLYVLRYDASIS